MKGRPRKYPDYDPIRTRDEFYREICEAFGTPYDDRNLRDEEAPSLNMVCNEFSISPSKARQILITNGYYSTRQSRRIAKLKKQGLSIQEIAERVGISASNVYSYLPYNRNCYKLKLSSADVERFRLYRKRKNAVALFRENGTEENMWNCVVLFENYPFQTMSGIPFKYTLKVGEDESYSKELLIKLRKECVAYNTNTPLVLK